MTYRNKRLKELGFVKKNTSSNNNANAKIRNKIIYNSQYEYKNINIARVFLNFLCIIAFILVLFITKNIYSISILLCLFFNLHYINRQTKNYDKDSYVKDLNDFKEKYHLFYLKNEKTFTTIENNIVFLKIHRNLLSLEDSHFVKNTTKNISILLNNFNDKNDELLLITLQEINLKLESLKVELNQRKDIVFKKQILFLKEKLK